MNSRPPGDFGNCRGPEGGGGGGGTGEGVKEGAHTHARIHAPAHPSTAKGAIRHPRTGSEDCVPPPSPIAPNPRSLLEVRESRDAELGGGVGRGMSRASVCGLLCVVGLWVHLLREAACDRRALSVGRPSGSVWVSPRRSLRMVYNVSCLSGRSSLPFAVCLLVTTSARADGASGGRETDGDAWAARPPRPPHSSCRHGQAGTHTHTQHIRRTPPHAT